MKLEIHLVDPAGGGIDFTGGVIRVKPLVLGVVATLDNVEPKFNAGALYVTQAALEKLGGSGVAAAYIDHLAGRWWNTEPEDRRDNDRAARAKKGVIYNIDRARGIMIQTYVGAESTLILSEEY